MYFLLALSPRHKLADNDTATAWVHAYGYAAVFVLMLLESAHASGPERGGAAAGRLAGLKGL